MTHPQTAALQALLDRVEAGDSCICQRCGGCGWLHFRCGTPWRCKCNQLPREYALATPDTEGR